MNIRKPVYLDYAATTPMDPQVADRMAKCLTADGNFGNPASRSHIYGWKAEESVELARRQVADLIGADPREIVWTSGATEADNLAIKGAARAGSGRGRHIVTSSIEHKAVLDTCAHMQGEGFDITWLKPDANGLTSPESVAAALREDTVLVSIMHANNETGVVNDIAAIGALCRERGALFHTDAAQSFGKIPIAVGEMNVDLMSLSAHKMYGPKGMGALYMRRAPEVRVLAEIHGGGHERGLRSGTLATHQIVGMGEAAEVAQHSMETEATRIAGLRDSLWGEAANPGRYSCERQRPVASARHLECGGRGGGRRGPADGPEGLGGFHRLRLHFRQRGAVPCPAGDGAARCARAQFHPHQPGAVHHPGGSGVCRRAVQPRGLEAARGGPGPQLPLSLRQGL